MSVVHAVTMLIFSVRMESRRLTPGMRLDQFLAAFAGLPPVIVAISCLLESDVVIASALVSVQHWCRDLSRRFVVAAPKLANPARSRLQDELNARQCDLTDSRIRHWNCQVRRF